MIMHPLAVPHESVIGNEKCSVLICFGSEVSAGFDSTIEFDISDQCAVLPLLTSNNAAPGHNLQAGLG